MSDRRAEAEAKEAIARWLEQLAEEYEASGEAQSTAWAADDLLDFIGVLHFGRFTELTDTERLHLIVACLVQRSAREDDEGGRGSVVAAEVAQWRGKPASESVAALQWAAAHGIALERTPGRYDLGAWIEWDPELDGDE